MSLKRKIHSKIPYSYPYTAEIFRETGSGIQRLTDKARIIRKTGGDNVLETVKLGKYSLPQNAARYGKQFKFYEDSEGKLKPIKFNKNTCTWEGIKGQDIRIYKDQIDVSKQLYPIDRGLMAGKAALAIVAIFILIASLPLFYLYYDTMTKMGSQIAATSENMIKVSQNLARASTGQPAEPTPQTNATQQEPPP